MEISEESKKKNKEIIERFNDKRKCETNSKSRIRRFVSVMESLFEDVE